MDDKSELDTAQIERRHLTVLECDLVGSTALAHKLDPEKLRDLIVRYQNSVLSWIEKFDGYFAQFAGDAVWVYFGYPKAREDDAVRAVQAGLGMAESVSSINLHGETLNVRVGIASGLCVVGNLRYTTEQDNKQPDSYVTAIGDPPNLAARLQTIARLGGVAISNETRILVGNSFEFEDLGWHQLKGFSEKVRAWSAVTESEEHNRYRALRPKMKSPLIGRSTELEEIRKLWKRSGDGAGQVVYLSGEPGIGKSRLIDSIAEDVVGRNFPQWWLHCSERLQGSPFAPLIKHIQTQANIRDTDKNRYEKIVQEYPELDDVGHQLLAELLSIEYEKKSEIIRMSASRQREQLYEVIIELIESDCKNKPMLIIVEDLHWIDPSTQALLQRLVLRSAVLPLLVIFSSRTINDNDKSFQELPQVHNFHLEQLTNDESRRLFDVVWRGDKLPENIVEKIILRTDGVPLFIEDLGISLRRMTESKPGYVIDKEVFVPSKLSDHLMSRIDSLGDCKQIVQIAAVVGREFSSDMIESLTNTSKLRLKSKLSVLVDSGLITVFERDNEKIYYFKHAMIRDAAYESLLIAFRKELHGRIANWLFSNQFSFDYIRAETIAYHFQSAGNYDMAIEYFLKAGQRYSSRCNYAEAIIHLLKAYNLISKLEPILKTKRIELDIIISLGVSYGGSSGISGDSTGKIYDKALQLCNELYSPPEVFPVLAGAGSFYFIRANYERSREIAEQSRELSIEKSNSTGRLISDRLLGAIQFITGNFATAIEYLENSIRIYDQSPRFHRSFVSMYALDHKSTAFCYLALAYAMIGKVERGIQISEEALSHAKSIDAHSMNCVLCYQTALFHLAEEPAQNILAVAIESFKLSVSEGYASWEGMSRLLKGGAIIKNGGSKTVIHDIERGVREHNNVNAYTFLPLAKSVLAEAHIANMQYREALQALDEAESLSYQTKQLWYIPEIQRLKALAYIELSMFEESIITFKKAFLLAQKTGAILWQEKIEKSMNKHKKYL